MQKIVFGNGPVRVCQPNGHAKSGTIVRNGDEYVVNGEWGYGSGSHHAEWTFCRAADPSGEVVVMAIPMKQLKIKPTWNVTGMRGTGSDTIVAENVVIPVVNTCPWVELIDPRRLEKRSHEPEPIDYFSHIQFLRSKTIAVIVGIARAIFDEMLKSAERPIITTTYEHKVDSQAFQASVGEACAKIDAAELIMMRAAHDNDTAALDRRQLTIIERATNRGGVGLMTDLLMSAVDQMMTLAGSSAFTETKAIARLWRDFGVASRHAAFTQLPSYEILGRHKLGVQNISEDAYI